MSRLGLEPVLYSLGHLILYITHTVSNEPEAFKSSFRYTTHFTFCRFNQYIKTWTPNITIKPTIQVVLLYETVAPDMYESWLLTLVKPLPPHPCEWELLLPFDDLLDLLPLLVLLLVQLLLLWDEWCQTGLWLCGLWGFRLGFFVGRRVGLSVSSGSNPRRVGPIVGLSEGCIVGWRVGDRDGLCVVGRLVGLGVCAGTTGLLVLWLNKEEC